MLDDAIRDNAILAIRKVLSDYTQSLITKNLIALIKKIKQQYPLENMSHFMQNVLMIPNLNEFGAHFVSSDPFINDLKIIGNKAVDLPGLQKPFETAIWTMRQGYVCLTPVHLFDIDEAAKQFHRNVEEHLLKMTIDASLKKSLIKALLSNNPFGLVGFSNKNRVLHAVFVTDKTLNGSNVMDQLKYICISERDTILSEIQLAKSKSNALITEGNRVGIEDESSSDLVALNQELDLSELNIDVPQSSGGAVDLANSYFKEFSNLGSFHLRKDGNNTVFEFCCLGIKKQTFIHQAQPLKTFKEELTRLKEWNNKRNSSKSLDHSFQAINNMSLDLNDYRITTNNLEFSFTDFKFTFTLCISKNGVLEKEYPRKELSSISAVVIGAVEFIKKHPPAAF